MDCSPPASSAHGILQARILEWVAISSSRGFYWPRDQTRISLSPVLASGFFTTNTTWEAFKSKYKEWQLRRTVFAEMSNQEEGQ